MQLFLRKILKLLFRVEVAGLDKLDWEKPSIILPNHISFLDPFILYPFLAKNVVFVVNTSIAKKFKFFFKWINHVTIDPLNPYSLRKVVKLIKEGSHLVIFPEGRITTTGNFMKLYNGIGLLAAKSNANVYPVILQGFEYSKLSRIKDKVKTRWFPKVTIYFDDKLEFDNDISNNFKAKKTRISDNILTALQNTKFKASMEFQKYDNIFDGLLKKSKEIRNKVIVQDTGAALTYKKLILTSYILGNKLKEILGNETRTGVLLPNSTAHVVTLFSLFFKGVTPAILNFTLGTSNNIDCAKTAELNTIITSKLFVRKAKLQRTIDEMSKTFKIVYLEDVKRKITTLDKLNGMLHYITNKKACHSDEKNIILFTSGSESKPKGVVLTHSNILANIEQTTTVIDLTHKDIMLNALPIFHSFGLTAGTLLPIIKGLKVFTYPTPLHYKIIPELAYDNNVTFLLGTPSFFLGYAKNAHHYDFHTIRYAVSGGEKLKDNVKDLWQQKFGIRIIEGYGTTEASPILSLNTPLFFKHGSVGKLLPGIQWKIEKVEGIEEGGNLLIKGPNVMKGYLLHGKGFVPCSEWYKCGDIVNIDKDGFVTIKARLKRFAKISGEMISLDSVETHARECFGDFKYAAISKPDAKKGERIILFTTCGNINKKTFQQYLSTNGHSMLLLPTEIVILEDLLLLGNGKINYVELSASV